jgi:hypothetical protein
VVSVVQSSEQVPFTPEFMGRVSDSKNLRKKSCSTKRSTESRRFFLSTENVDRVSPCVVTSKSA